MPFDSCEEPAEDRPEREGDERNGDRGENEPEEKGVPLP